MINPRFMVANWLYHVEFAYPSSNRVHTHEHRAELVVSRLLKVAINRAGSGPATRLGVANASSVSSWPAPRGSEEPKGAPRRWPRSAGPGGTLQLGRPRLDRALPEIGVQ